MIVVGVTSTIVNVVPMFALHATYVYRYRDKNIRKKVVLK